MEKYDTVSEFHRNAQGAYQKALKNGWLYEKKWNDGRAMFAERITKWTREKCMEKAKMCVSRGDFCKKFPNVYQKAWHKGWLDDYTWFLPTENLLENGGTVYSYEFPDRCVYVGITIRPPSVRDAEHRREENMFSAVREHSRTTGLPIPEMRILERNLGELDMKRLESEHVERYRNLGYSILNRARTGVYSGSVGRLHRVKWTRDACMELAKTCTTRAQLQRKSKTAYSKANRNGWMDDYTWFESGLVVAWNARRKWTRERCLELARTCSGRGEMKKRSQSAYEAARKKGWLSDYVWFKTTRELLHERLKWSYDRCLEVARKCRTRVEMKDMNCSAYERAYKEGWVADYTWFESGKGIGADKRRIWTLEKCAEVARTCESRGGLKRKSYCAYDVLRRAGRLDEFFPKRLAAEPQAEEPPADKPR